MSVWIFFWAHKSRKHSSNVTKLGYVFHIKNLLSYNKNYNLFQLHFIGLHQNFFKPFFKHYFWMMLQILYFFFVFEKGLVFMGILLLLMLPFNPKITFFTFDLRVCVPNISITQKQFTAEISNLVFYICITSKCYLKLFMKIGPKLCVQGYTKEF